MKKNRILFLFIFVATLTLNISCSDNAVSSETQKHEYYNKEGQGGPDECNQDEYEDESKDMSTEIEEECVERNVPNVPADKGALYSIRDNILANSERGKRYIEEYYFTSKVEKDYSQFTVGNYVDVIELMPFIYNAQEKYLDPKYNDAIISSECRDKLVKVLLAYKKLSKDGTYHSMIDAFITDVNTITGKKKADVIAFMENK